MPSGPMSWKRWTFPPRAPIRVGRRTAVGRPLRAASTRSPTPLALHRRARLRARRARGSRIASCSTDRPSIRDYRARRAVGVRRRRRVRDADLDLLLHVDGDRSGGDRAASTSSLTELDDGYVVRVGSAAGAGARSTRSTCRSPTQPAIDAAAGGRRRSARRDGHPDRHVRRSATGCRPPRTTRAGRRSPSAAWPARTARSSARPASAPASSQKSDLDGTTSTSERTWDSCFADGFAKVAGGSFRPHAKDRYRQWLTHKFSTWWDQFGSSGCVGCGRCIAWCPVGIDVREELAVIAGAGPIPMPQLDVRRASAAVARGHPGRPRPAHARLTARAAGLGGFVSVHVDGTTRETADTVTLHLRTTDRALLAGRPGQFVMAALPAFSAAPISVSRFRPDGLDLTIRAAGPATRALTALERGATPRPSRPARPRLAGRRD